jgi:hypothetical protein
LEANASLLGNEIAKTARQLKKILDLGVNVRYSALVTTDDDVAHQKRATFSNKFYFAVFGNNFDPSAV